MKTVLFMAALTAAIFLSGCATPLPPGAEPGPEHTMAYNILIEASDPGARIEVNGEQVGNAPMNLKVFGDPDGTFHDFGSYFYVIRALPVATNQFAQVRAYRTGRGLAGEDRIPQRIYFDMNQPPAPPLYSGYPPYYEPYGPQFYIYGGPGFYYGPRVYIHGPPPPFFFHHRR